MRLLAGPSFHAGATQLAVDRGVTNPKRLREGGGTEPGSVRLRRCVEPHDLQPVRVGKLPVVAALAATKSAHTSSGGGFWWGGLCCGAGERQPPYEPPGPVEPSPTPH